MELIKCSLTILGHKQAQELVIDLNAIKSSESEDFYIQYDKNQNYSQNDNYAIIGNVTQGDWIMLNYMNFLQNVLQN